MDGISDTDVKQALRRLRRIDNAMKYLVRSTGFKYRNAFDNLRGDAKAMQKAVSEEDAFIEQAVERIMETGG